MERSQLSLRNIVAVYPATPVPTDPYARGFREHVRPMIVTDLTDGQIIVMNVETSTEPGLHEGEEPMAYGNAEAVTPRQVIARWDDWARNVADREARAHQQTNRQQRRIDDEATALAQAVAAYPTARMENHCIVIPVPDWLAATDGR